MKLPSYTICCLILSILILQSCSTFKNIADNQANQITKENFTEINGLYLNQPSNTKEISFERTAGPGCFSTSLWENKYGCLSNKRQKDTAFGTIKIDFVNRRKIRLTLIKDYEPQQTKNLKGRVKDGYFYGKHRFMVYPFIPLYFGYSSYRYRISKTEHGIAMDSKWSYWGFALFGGGDGKGEFLTEYSKY